jgi:catechol 2,3-dioxygenase-like lactoylglutathione lyase family enzyme
MLGCDIALRLHGVEERPPVWVGHVVHAATDVRRSALWWGALGMRAVFERDDMAIFELRGGTHLLIFPSDHMPPPGTRVPFDLMVDDIEAARADFEARGLAPSGLTSAAGDHLTFTVDDPDGYTLTVFDSHVIGPV